jgi:hypothetical protein
MTHPIIAYSYADRQRQQTRLQDARIKLADAIRSAHDLEPQIQQYADNKTFRGALVQQCILVLKLAEVRNEMDRIAAEISDSLSAPDAHLKGYPQ